MIQRLPLYFILCLLLAMGFAACNSDSESVVSDADYKNCGVTSFNLKADTSVLRNLDSVFFSIDLNNAIIYNADSLPVGTDVSHVLVNIGTSSAKEVKLSFRCPETGNDTTVSYVSSPNDSINFADGPVKLEIVSYDGTATREYTLKVNIHTQNPDTLCWDDSSIAPFPTSLAAPAGQKTAQLGAVTYCLTADGSGNACLSSCSDLYGNVWTKKSVTLPAGADVRSFSATSEALFITDASGALFTSVDGSSWTDTGAKMTWVYGGYSATLIGALRDASGVWKHVTYPATTEVDVPAGCPVEGTSNMVYFENKWSDYPLAILIGGTDATGALTGGAWGYDGQVWGKISAKDIDETRGMTLISYTTPRYPENSWTVTERPTLIALGGDYIKESGEKALSRVVYVSYNQGISWSTADTYLEFPEKLPGFTGAQAFIEPKTLYVGQTNPDNGWVPLAASNMPVWAWNAEHPEAAPSRVSVPVTSWECPYIYLFGGYDAARAFAPMLWRGAIRRFTFQPLY